MCEHFLMICKVNVNIKACSYWDQLIKSQKHFLILDRVGKPVGLYWYQFIRHYTRFLFHQFPQVLPDREKICNRDTNKDRNLYLGFWHYTVQSCASIIKNRTLLVHDWMVVVNKASPHSLSSGENSIAKYHFLFKVKSLFGWSSPTVDNGIDLPKAI